MLTQCPECKTAFRLHVNQLKAAAGKVRCSRCNTTFDALDNLFEHTPPAVEESPQAAAPQLPTEQSTAPEPAPEETASPTEPLTAPIPGADEEDEALERITSLFDEPDEPDAPPSENDEDPLSSFIDELEVSTTNSETVSLPPVGESAHQDLPPDIAAALDALGEDATTNEAPTEEDSPQEPIHLPPVGSHTEPQEDVISAALDSIDELFGSEPGEEETLPLVDLEEPVEDFEEELTVEPLEEEPLPLVELEEPQEDFEEELTVEPLEEEPLPLVELEEPAEDFEEELTVEPVEEETLPLVELEEPVEDFEEELTVEPLEEETLPLVEDEELSVDPFEETATPQTEPDEPIISEDELDAFFEEATPEAEEEGPAESVIDEDELDAFFEEATPEAEEEGPVESVIDEDELDAFFEETTPEAEEEGPAESVIGEDELDAFFEEEVETTTPAPLPEQGDLLDLLEEESAAEAIDQLLSEPDEESALDEVVLPDEAVEAVEPTAPATPRPATDPLDPFSEEQLEHMLSPTEEQAAEEVTSQQAPRYTPAVVELDSAAPAMEESLTEDERVLSQPPATSGYAIPAELTQAKQASVRGTLLWGLGTALMCGVLVLQYLYYFRLQLVENPQLRPLLTSMCDVTGCELPPRRDLGHIELSEHLMQFHPKYEQSLLITATLANRAEFAQPYPLVEVLMTDIEQRVVARRHFTPQQYMPNYGGDSFPANSEIPLMLEVLDPGNSAVGFEFRFY